MHGQEIADGANGFENGVRVLSLLHQIGHHTSHFLPELVATFLMDSRISDDGELLARRRDENQDAVPMPGPVHPELCELLRSFGQRRRDFPMRNEHADFAGALELRSRDRIRDPSFVEQIDEFLCFHPQSPASARAATTEASSASRETAHRKTTTTTTTATPASPATATAPVNPR